MSSQNGNANKAVEPPSVFSLRRFVPRSREDWDAALAVRGVIGEDPKVTAAVESVVADIRRRGDEALAGFATRFDGAELTPDRFRVSDGEWDALADACPAPVREALELAARRIATFHRAQLPTGFRIEEDGAVLEQRIVPLDSVLCYTPGGLATYPSTVLMTAVPAKVAGVGRVVVTSPAKGKGDVSPAIAAAARIAGADELWRVGGAQAVAAFALGTDTIERVDKVVGPGNAYVTEAKRVLAAEVGIDLLAGPTEVMIIAEEGVADPRWIAADLIAQAEHDPGARSVLVTPSTRLADEVERAIALESPGEVACAALKAHGSIVICPLDEALAFAQRYAPEHLELLLHEPREALPRVTTAGAVFVGAFAPVPVGDYLAGPNHTLPTAGTGRFSSGLGIADFVRRQTLIEYTPERLAADAGPLRAIAEAEGLPAHGRAAVIRGEVGSRGTSHDRPASGRITTDSRSVSGGRSTVGTGSAVDGRASSGSEIGANQKGESVNREERKGEAS